VIVPHWPIFKRYICNDNLSTHSLLTPNWTVISWRIFTVINPTHQLQSFLILNLSRCLFSMATKFTSPQDKKLFEPTQYLPISPALSYVEAVQKFGVHDCKLKFSTLLEQDCWQILPLWAKVPLSLKILQTSSVLLKYLDPVYWTTLLFLA